ncbi:MAG: cbb3-type cytochrome c oxidase subunit I [Myxococcales bacterium]
MDVSRVWLRGAVATFVAGFAVLGWLAYRMGVDRPPIPERVVAADGRTLFVAADVLAGQQVFQKNALMQYGTLFGHGAYLGPDFTAEHLHRQALEMAAFHERAGLSPAEAQARTQAELKRNAYDPATGTLTLGPAQAASLDALGRHWRDAFQGQKVERALQRPRLTDEDARALGAYFAWAAWTASAQRPDKAYSYTNNWPPEPLAGNTPTQAAFLWSVLSLVALLGGTGIVFFVFGRWQLLGWHRGSEPEPQPAGASVRFRNPGEVALTPSQRATPWYFLVIAGLFLAQGLLGGANAHYHVEPAGFYGFDLSSWLPYQLTRVWHVQLALFFVAASFLAMGIFIVPLIAGREPKGQHVLALALFAAVVLVVVGSLAGEAASVHGAIGQQGPWFWLGTQGWEYLDLGRLWQILLTAGMVIWVVILARGLRGTLRTEHPGNMPWLLLYSAISIPLFYSAGMFFSVQTSFAVVDFWRFWVVHLWVEDFLELFTTIMVAYVFVLLGVVPRPTATRVVYLDVILYSVGGVLGTMHHLYFSGAPAVHLALGAFFSAMEVIPLVLLTYEAWRFMQLGAGATGTPAAASGAPAVPFPHRWAVSFLIAVGFWNFLGAGVFGFLINLPIVSYWEIGTQLTANHGHGALMGVYGMLAVGFFMFVARYFLPADRAAERAMKLSFWGLNVGLALMMFANLVPIGLLQLADAFTNGYWHAREPAFFQQPAVRFFEWLRLPGDVLFIVLGILPVVYLAVRTWLARKRGAGAAAGTQESTGLMQPR